MSPWPAFFSLTAVFEASLVPEMSTVTVDPGFPLDGEMPVKPSGGSNGWTVPLIVYWPSEPYTV